MCPTSKVPSRIAVFGAGGAGREIEWLARECMGEDTETVFVVDGDFAGAHRINGRRVLAFQRFIDDLREFSIVVAVGDPNARRQISRRCADAGLRFATLVHPTVQISNTVTIGQGSMICAGAVVTTNIRIGQHVYINVGATVSHDCILDDFSTLCPGVHVAGWVTVGNRAFLGVGSSISNGVPEQRLEIGAGAIVGAGSCVLGSVASNATVTGVPARASGGGK